LPETPELEARVAKMQKDLEQVKDFIKDTIHDDPQKYKKRVFDCLNGHPACIALWLEIDGKRSLMEIENELKTKGKPINHVTLWRASERLSPALVSKVGVKGKSPVYSKKPWADELRMDDFVREKFNVQ